MKGFQEYESWWNKGQIKMEYPSKDPISYEEGSWNIRNHMWWQKSGFMVTVLVAYKCRGRWCDFIWDCSRRGGIYRLA